MYDIIKDYLDNGKSVVPVYGKISKVQGWQNYCQSLPDSQEIDRWKNVDCTGLGLLSGKQNNLCFVDIDETDPVWLNKLLVTLPQSPVSKKGRKGETRFFQLPKQWEGYGNIVTIKRNGKSSVEFFFNNKYTVIPPSKYIDENKHYPEFDFRWNGLDQFLPSFDVDMLPELDLSIIDELRGSLPDESNIPFNNTNGRYDKIKKYACVLVSQLTPYDQAATKLIEYDINHHPNNPYFLDKTKGCITSNARINAYKYYADMVVSINRNKKIGEPLEVPIEIRQPEIIDKLCWDAPVDYRKFTQRPEFKTELIPDKFKKWIMTISDESGLQTDAVLMTALTGLSAVIGSKVGLLPKMTSNWRIAPNIYSMMIFNSGGRKSQISNVALSPVKRLAAQLQKQGEKEAKDKQVKDSAVKIEIADLKERSKKAIRDDNAEEATKLLEKMQEKEASLEEETFRRLIVKQSTPEALMITLSKNQEGLLIIENELSGLLAKMKKQGYETYRSLLLDMWDGTESGTYDTVARGRMHIPLLCGSFLAFGQPDLLTRVVKDAANGHNDGLIQRFLIITDDMQERFINPDIEIDRKIYDEINYIFEIALKYEKRDIALSDDAFKLWKKILIEYESEASREKDKIVQGLLRKRNSNLLCLSFLYQFIDDHTVNKISIENLERGYNLVKYITDLAVHAIKESTNVVLDLCDILVRMIQLEEIKNGVKLSDIMKCDKRLVENRDITQRALSMLTKANIIKFQQEGKSMVAYFNPSPIKF